MAGLVDLAVRRRARHQARRRGWRRCAALVALLGCVVVAGCYPVPPDPLWEPGSGSVREVDDRAPRVLVLGDSVADQLGSHAALALREVGIEVGLDAWWGWGLLTREQYDMGATNPAPPEGSMMESASAAIASYDPDVVVVYANHNYWWPYPRDAAGNEIAYGSAQFTQMVQTQLRELVERVTVGGATLLLAKPLPEYGSNTAATNAIWTSYLTLRDELGFGVINAGDVVAHFADHTRVEDLLDCADRSTRVRPENDLHLTYYGAGLMGSVTARAIAGALGMSLDGSTAPAELPAAMLPYSAGYRLVTCDGATFRGHQEGEPLGGVALSSGRDNGDPVVAASNLPPATAAWAVTAKGKVVGYAGAASFGDVTGLLADGESAVGIVATASGRGYWIVTDQSRVHRFGDATALGDLAGSGETVVAMAGTPNRTGYWLLTASGRIVPFGSAGAHGDLQGRLPAEPLVALAAHPGGQGYWVLDAAGNVHPFGAAPQLGSAANQDLLRVTSWQYPGGVDYEVVPAWQMPTTAVTLLPTTSGNGYWVWLANGAVCHFGDAPILGGVHRGQLDFPMVLLGLPFYGTGNCAQAEDAPSPTATDVSSLASTADAAHTTLPPEDLQAPPTDAANPAIAHETDLGADAAAVADD
jgi:SGNH domain (fused to AT3 domains)